MNILKMWEGLFNMSTIKINTDLYYENIIVPLQDAVSVMQEVIQINDELRYWYDFSERHKLQEFIDNCRDMKSEMGSLEQFAIDSKKTIEDSITNLKDKANLLPTSKIEGRNRLNI